MIRLAIVLAALLVVGVAATCGDAAGQSYDVSLQFDETYEEADIEEVGDLLLGYDPDAEIAILESFPPQLRTTLTTDEPDFCATVVAELEGRSYVREASCDVHEDAPADGGDEPVASTPVDY